MDLRIKRYLSISIYCSKRSNTTNPWLAFALGVFVGGVIGIVMMCLMNVASMADARMMPSDNIQDDGFEAD